MADVLALEHLFDAVVARFKADGTHVPNVFGWREPAKQEPSPRICWIPGDPNGSVGEILPARSPGGNPRSLATLRELFTVEINSHDPSAPEDERRQYHATRVLYDAWFRAAHLAAAGVFLIEASTWLADRTERRHGACLRVVASIEAVIPDKAHELAPADTGADITTSMHDNDEHTVVNADDEEEP